MTFNKLKTTTSLTTADGQVLAHIEKSLAISANVSIENVSLGEDGHLRGDIVLTVDFGVGTASFDLPFDVDTGVSNPVAVDFGSINLPLVGAVEVVGLISFDIPGRQVCAELTLEGVISVAKVCTRF